MISVYIVTYRSPQHLHANIESLLVSGADVRINVINNHSEFYLAPEHERFVNVLHNNLRPDFSTGHLARSWNQALLHGFQNLLRPASEVVVTVQDDVVFKAGWLSYLTEFHRRYSFITMGVGDALCSYLPEAVRKIGLWDERFCNIGFQEADYFLRALIYNREGSSINDVPHGRQHNAVDGNKVHYCEGDGSDELGDRMDSLLITVPKKDANQRDGFNAGIVFNSLTYEVFKHKWGVDVLPLKWGPEHYDIRGPLVPSFMTYPYFEKDVEGLLEKNYIVPKEC